LAKRPTHPAAGIKRYTVIPPTGRATAHFDWSEIACHHCGKIPHLGACFLTAQMMEEIRKKIGVPIHITSWCRCPEYNAQVSGEELSYHIPGYAVDWRPVGRTVLSVYPILKLMQGQHPGIGGLGRYDEFHHTDRGPVRSWDERTK
jgi:peptidase M15-like protein